MIPLLRSLKYTKDRYNLICNFLLTNYMSNRIIKDGNVHALFIGVLY
jgi:hypothetical protein